MKKIAFLSCLLAASVAQAQIVESESGDYALIPATGTNTIDLSTKTEGYSFKIYDDGGLEGDYAENANGYMLITAPTGYNVRVEGMVYTESGCDYFYIYDGTSASDNQLLEISGGFEDDYLPRFIDIICSGQSMLLHLTNDDDYGASGLNLTATIVNYVKNGDFLFTDDTYTELVKYVGAGGMVTIPGSVRTIGAKAFSGSKGVKSVVVPNAVHTIGENAFEGVARVAYIGSATGAPWGASVMNGVIDGDFIYSDETKAELIMYAGNGGTVNVPNGVETIKGNAFPFTEDYTINMLTIPASVTKIGESAFNYNTKIVSYASIESLCAIEFENGVNSSNEYAQQNAHGDDHKLYINGAEVTALTIPNTVTSIGRYAFINCSKITSVSIPASVTSIGEFAFYGCSGLTKTTYASLESLCSIEFGSGSANPIGCGSYYGTNNLYFGDTKITSVTFPESITSIGNYAFYGCKLTSINFGSVTSIGDYAFYGNSCSTITIPNTVTHLGKGAFYYCRVQTVNIGSGLTTISENAFDNCSYMKTVNIANGVQTIEKNAFYFCQRLESLTIPESVTSIGEKAFYYSKVLASVDIPATVTSIGEDAFSGTRIVNYTGTATGAPWGACAVNGVVDGDFVYADAAKTILVGYAGTAKSVTIPEGVVEIGDEVFDNRGITSVTFPSTLKRIGKEAFYLCSFSSISFPENMEYIGEGAFYNCDNITSVTITAEEIARDAFRDCNKLKTVVMTDNVKKIGASAFFATQFTSLTLGNSVQSIGDGAFSHAKLTSLVLPNSLEEFGSYGNYFNTLESTSSVTTENGAKYLGNSTNPHLVLVKATATDITECTINENCKIIAGGAFSGCGSLESIEIPEAVTFIGNRAFSSCGNLATVEIPETVTKIGESAFYNVKCIMYDGDAEGRPWGALSMNIEVDPESDFIFADEEHTIVTRYVGSSANVVIPEGVVEIGNNTFSNANIVSVQLPSTLTNFGSAFSYCSNLSQINIPSSIESIEDYAFQGCISLMQITIPSTVVSMGEYVFCNSFITVTTEWASKPISWDNKWADKYNGSSATVIWGNVQPDKAEGFTAFNEWFADGVNAPNVAAATAPDGSSAMKMTVTKAAADGFSNSNFDDVQLCNIFHGMEGQTEGSSFKLTFEIYSDNESNKPAHVVIYTGKQTGCTPEIHAYGMFSNNKTELLDAEGQSINLKDVEVVKGQWNAVTLEGEIGEAGEDYIGISICMGGYANNVGNFYIRNINVEIDGATVANDNYTLTAAVNNADYGTVTGGGNYGLSQTATITATPKTGYKFVKWSDGSTDSERSVVVTCDTLFTAEFAPITYTVTLTAGKHGTVLGGGQYDYGTMAFIRAKADEGYYFVKWNDSSEDNIYSGRPITVTGDMSFTAQFAPRDTVKIEVPVEVIVEVEKIVEKIVEVPTSAKQAKAVNMSVYPNPTTSFVTATADTEFSYFLTNTAGVVLQKDENAASYVIDLTEFADGVYILNTSDGAKYKIVKK